MLKEIKIEGIEIQINKVFDDREDNQDWRYNLIHRPDLEHIRVLITGIREFLKVTNPEAVRASKFWDGG